MFFILTSIMAIFCFLFIFISGYVTIKNPQFAGQFTRHKLVGGILMIVTLIWLVIAGANMLGLPPNSSTFSICLITAPILGVAFTYFLDFITTRALGSLLLLILTTIIDLAFINDIPQRGILSSISYLIVFGAFYCIIWPYTLRDILVYCQKNKKIRFACIGIATCFGIIFSIYSSLFFIIER